MTIKKISVTPSEALQRHIDDKSKEIKDKATPGASYFKGSILADLAEAGLRLPQVEASLGSARGELLGVREELAAAQNDLAIARAELARHQDREQRAKSTAKDAQAALAVESRLREELGAARRTIGNLKADFAKLDPAAGQHLQHAVQAEASPKQEGAPGGKTFPAGHDRLGPRRVPADLLPEGDDFGDPVTAPLLRPPGQ
jgi:chromosome segregation ATPase